MTARPRRQHERNPGPATQPGRTSDPAPPGDTTTTDRVGQHPPSGRLAYSLDEAARLTGISRDLLYDEMRRGNLTYLKVGRRRLITRQHLNQFLGIAS
jgi:excisionase family DNA binding protein